VALLAGASTSMVMLMAGQPASAAAPTVRAQNGQACTVVGTKGNDKLRAVHGRDVVCGLGGNDTITGAAGDDVLDGGTGNDVVVGGADRDKLNGGTGTDTVSYADHTTPVTADLNGIVGDGSTGENDTVSGDVENLTGGTGNDTLTGDAATNVIDGGAGDDSVRGGAGNDALTGGTGNDILTGGAGSDTFHAGPGMDTVSYLDHSSPVTADLNGAVGDGSTGENDTVSGDVENLTGGTGNDTLTGDAATNVIDGGAGDDSLGGGAGNDTLTGGDGDDSLDGGPGVDRLDGGAGLNDCVADSSDIEMGQSCSDVAPPEMDPASFSWAGPTAVDNATATTVAVRLRASDDRSGVKTVMAWLSGPGGTRLIGSAGAPVTGTPTNGTWAVAINLPEGASAGEWRLTYVCAIDGLSHRSCFSRDDQGVFHLVHTAYANDSNGPVVPLDLAPLQVSGASDVEAPQVDPESIAWLTATELDNAVANTIKLRLHLTDDVSGMPYVSGTLVNSASPATSFPMPNQLVSGTITDGIWELTGTVPAHAPAGEYTVVLSLTDMLEHRVTYKMVGGTYVDADTGAEAGFQIAPVMISGPSDEAAPVIDSFWWSGGSEFTNNVDNTVTLRVHATDELSGTFFVAAVLGIPGVTEINSGLTLANPKLVSGTTTDGVWELTGVLPKYAAAGTWQPLIVYANDAVGHQKNLRLDAEGHYRTWDGELTDVVAPVLTVHDSHVKS
jgi:hypothetical protein